MSDLISKSELINALKVHFDSCFREDGELLYSDHICTSDDVVDLIKLVENQPTAYSVDKVVEELESAENYYYDDKIDEEGDLVMFKSIEQSVAIEIVKQGGVSDIEKTLQNAYGTNKSYHEQLAEWLEELKKRRSEDYGYLADIHQSIGYRKAIDDFVNACKEDILCQTFGLHINGIERIAEQLKVGGENERSI